MNKELSDIEEKIVEAMEEKGFSFVYEDWEDNTKILKFSKGLQSKTITIE